MSLHWTEAQAEIADAIAFYQERGWEWLGVVGYLSARALGTLPHDVIAKLYRDRARPRSRDSGARREAHEAEGARAMVKARQRGVYWLTVGPEPYLVTCQRCGKREVPPELPTPLAAAILYMQHLVAKHRHCQPVEEAPAVQVNET